MPTGVRREFLDLLRRQRTRSRGRLKLVPAALVSGYVVAELADPSALGAHVWTYLASLAVAGPVTWILAGRHYAGIEDDLRSRWDRWMAASPADGIVEAHERVSGESGLLSTVPQAAALLAFANLGVLAMLWFEAPTATAVALPVVVLDAVAVAAWTAWHARTLTWCRTLDQAVHELYADGELGIYGAA